MDYKIVYSARKTLGLSIKDGELTVRAPYGYPAKKIDEAVKRHYRWIDEHRERSIRKTELEPKLCEADIARLKANARIYFKEKCEYFAPLMGTDYKRITITGAKTRFGSCSSSGGISFSYRLMLYPERAREYVVIHELAHRFEMNHSKRFYAIIEKYMKDYRIAKDMLNGAPDIKNGINNDSLATE